ncbi:hypothetical protein AAEX37_01467 [Oligella sp. MSHR50489EDL]|uniref:hypothetical protein n=1 Tax=Oligella sp. MSHR50489EDL TaxID=3139409 RepID=UPI003D815576
MTRYSKFVVPLLATLSLSACGDSKDDPQHQLTVIRFNFINACTFYAGNRNANFCGCAYDEMLKQFGQENVLALGGVSDESELSDPAQIETFREMQRFIAGTTEGVCKDLIIEKPENDPNNKTFFRRLIPEK